MSVARLARRKNKVTPSSALSAPKPPPSTRSNAPSIAWRRVRPPICRASSFTSTKLGTNRIAKASTAAAAEPQPKLLISPLHSWLWNSFSMATATTQANSEMTSCTKPRTKPMAAPPMRSRNTKTSSAVIGAALAERKSARQSGSAEQAPCQVVEDEQDHHDRHGNAMNRALRKCDQDQHHDKLRRTVPSRPDNLSGE